MNKKIQQWFFYHDENKDHVKALDGLRGIAVILVLLSHASNNDIYFLNALRFNGIGKGGVYLFFILSAYLLDRQIAVSMRNHTADFYFWKRYFLRRFLRIYPLLLIALLFFLLLTTQGLNTCITNGHAVLQHLLLLDGCSVFWSIPVEFKYYFISPLILWICHSLLKWDLLKTGIFLMTLALGLLVTDILFDFNKISLFKYLVVFLTGTFVAIFNILRSSQKESEWISKYRWIIGFTALFLCLFLNPNYVGDWMGISVSNNGRKIMLIYAFLCGTMLFTGLYDQRYFRKFLEIKALRLIGVISYSVYLFHMPVIYLLREKIIQVPSFLSIWFFLGATFTLALMTYFLIERPLARIRIPKRSPARANPLL